MAKSLTGWKYSFRVLGGKLGGDWERDRRDTLFLMVAIALSILTHVPHLPLWVSIAFSILFFWRLGLVLSGRWLPRTSVRLIAAFAAALGVYAEHKTLLGRDAGVSLLVLFLGLKLMEMQAKRDLFVVNFLCMLLLLLAFLYSQNIATAVMTMIALMALTATLMSMQFGFHEAPLPKRLKLSAVLLVKSLPVAAVLFVLFPRIEQPLWRMPSDANKGRTGLSDSMSPGSISELTESDAIAFRVQFHDEAPAQDQLYWRGPVFGFYDGKTWKAPKYDVVAPPTPSLTYENKGPLYAYTVTVEPQGRQQIFALEQPVSMPMIGERSAQLQPDYQLVHPDLLGDRFRYSASSRTDTKIGLNETALSLQNWLSLPPGFNPRTLQLALDWRNQESDNRKLIERALTQFRKDKFFYTMQPPL
jgi:protein-glutamine gamma-glutamyltransferase